MVGEGRIELPFTAYQTVFLTVGRLALIYSKWYSRGDSNSLLKVENLPN
jgi:hypothetical protein